MGFMKKYLLYIIAAAGLVVLGYGTGNLHGYKSGYEEGEDSKKQEIKDLKTQIELRDEDANRKATAANKRIEELVKESQIQTGKIHSLQEALDKKQTQIVKEYEVQYVQSANSCGLDLPTVQTINKLLAAAKESTR